MKEIARAANHRGASNLKHEETKMKNITRTLNLVAVSHLNVIIKSLEMSSNISMHNGCGVDCYIQYRNAHAKSRITVEYSASPDEMHTFKAIKFMNSNFFLLIAPEASACSLNGAIEQITAATKTDFAHLDFSECDYDIVVARFPFFRVEPLLNYAYDLCVLTRAMYESLTAAPLVTVLFEVRRATAFVARTNDEGSEYYQPLFRRGDALETADGSVRFRNRPIHCADGDLSPVEAAKEYFADPIKNADLLYSDFIQKG